MAELNHIGLFVRDLEAARIFFEKYFDAKSCEMYHNSQKSFSSYTLKFDEGSKLEIMSRPGLADAGCQTNRYGYAHISMSVGSKENVDIITERLINDGYEHFDGPRTTGDGFYESAILDAEGNIIEITV